MASKRIRALLIEDNPDDASLLQESLPDGNGTEESIEIDWVVDLSSALKKLETNRFSIVLLDLSLPDSIHLDALKKLRLIYPHIPIIILTGLDDKGVAIEAVKSGAQDYLVKGKPSAESLQRCMRYAIERNSLEESIRKSAEEARQSQAKLELALTASQLGVYSWNIFNSKISCDERVRLICGFEESEIELDVLIDRVVLPEDLPKVRKAVEACLCGKEPFETEFRVVWSDGSIHEVSSVGQAFFDNDGTAMRLTGVVRDITKQVEIRKREQRFALLEQREEFIAMLAHDLRCPISGAQRLLENLIQGKVGPILPSQSTVLEAIAIGNQCMLHNINNILDVYRLEACSVTGPLIEQGLSKIISACVAETEPIAESKNISLTWQPSDIGMVMIDGLAMGRVITNLITNALKFTPEGGHVEVNLSARDGRAIIQVRDNGIGIDQASQEKLFQRFYQSDRKNRRTGLGLGLYLCRRFVEGQHGSIKCISEPGKGATFEISLPLKSAESSRIFSMAESELTAIG